MNLVLLMKWHCIIILFCCNAKKTNIPTSQEMLLTVVCDPECRQRAASLLYHEFVVRSWKGNDESSVLPSLSIRSWMVNLNLSKSAIWLVCHVSLRRGWHLTSSSSQWKLSVSQSVCQSVGVCVDHSRHAQCKMGDHPLCEKCPGGPSPCSLICHLPWLASSACSFGERMMQATWPAEPILSQSDPLLM